MDFAEQFAELFTVHALVSFLTLSALEIVLGIDNIIFISIVAAKLPDKIQQRKARFTGLMIALLMRVLMLLSIVWIIGLKKTLFTILGLEISGRDLILFAGGIFLLIKTTLEIHNKIEGRDEPGMNVRIVSLSAIVFQIVIIDIIFSFDSILTAVGLVRNVLIMILAVMVAIFIMLFFSEMVSNFINRNPTIKMLALAFLLMIGMVLILDAFHIHVPKEFIYVSMAFSLLVEGLNMRMRSRRKQRGQNPHF